MISFLRVVVQTVSLLLTCMYVCVDNDLEDVYVARYFERTFQCKPPTGINHIPINQSMKREDSMQFGVRCSNETVVSISQ